MRRARVDREGPEEVDAEPIRGVGGNGGGANVDGAVSRQTFGERVTDGPDLIQAEADAGLDDVAKATVYVTESDFLPSVNETVLRRLGKAAPAFTTVVVKGLASPELLMEVDIVAIKKSGQR